KNPKWLTRIELLDEADGRVHRRHGCGFYKQQGWAREGDVIPTHSRIDAPQVRGDHFESPFQVGKTVELRGMAFGGDRGISKVEISTDDGDTWDTAEITKPGTKLSWSLWGFQWTPDEEGEAKVLVRATDGEGQEQIGEYRDQVRDGAAADRAMTAAAFGLPMWGAINVILLPLFAGQTPQWTAEGMRTLFPALVGWLLFGFALGLLATGAVHLAERLFGATPVAPARKIPEVKTHVVILGGGFAGVT